MGFNATCSNDTYFYQSCDRRLFPSLLSITNSNDKTLCDRYQCQQERKKIEISLNSFWLQYEGKLCDGVNDCQNTNLDEVGCADKKRVKSEQNDCANKSYNSKTERGYNGDEKNCSQIKSKGKGCGYDKISLVRTFFECRPFVNRDKCCGFLLSTQTNCTEEEEVGVVCEVNGYSTSISMNVMCPPLAGVCRVCDDGIEGKCIVSSLSCTLHKHLFCDGYYDCDDKSDETNSICKTTTEGTCQRRVGNITMRAKEQEIPLAWLRDGVKDCADGSDESGGNWTMCGEGKTLRFKEKHTTCENVYICQSGEPGFVELSELCDGTETCGNENKVCSAAQNKQKLETKVLGNTEGLTKKCSFCMGGLQELQRHNLHCTIKNFIFPDHDFYGVSTKTKVILPQNPQNCDHMYGEQYVYTSCTGKCTNSVCPLKTIPRYEVCPSQFPKRVGTLANNEYLAFFTVSKGNAYINRYFVCENNQTCLDYSQVCDLINDCDDGSDETDCTNHFKCNSSESYILKTSVCDGVFDCKDLSDECNKDCSKQILKGDTLKVFSWLIGVLAALANIIILIRHTIGLLRSRNAVVLVNKSLMILICLGDFLIGGYLITVSVYDSLIFKSEYCHKQVEWIATTECSIIGVFSTIGSQISLFSMTGLSIVRIYVIWTSRSRNTLRQINLKNAIVVVGIVLFVTVASVAIAVIPNLRRFEDFFVNGIRFRDELKIFIGTPDKRTVLNILGAYHGRMTGKTIPSWNRILAMVNEMFSHDLDYQDLTLEVKKVHFYGNDGVCLFKYFVNEIDPQKVYVWSILAMNFSCFLLISTSYLLILFITSRSSNATGNQNESNRMKSMNRKIAFIITTDFFCWIPFIVVCCLHSIEVVDATQWYGLFSMIILPINSMINPFLYDDFMIRSVRKKQRELLDFLTSFSAFIINRNSSHEASVEAGGIEMQQIDNQAE